MSKREEWRLLSHLAQDNRCKSSEPRIISPGQGECTGAAQSTSLIKHCANIRTKKSRRTQKVLYFDTSLDRYILQRQCNAALQHDVQTNAQNIPFSNYSLPIQNLHDCQSRSVFIEVEEYLPYLIRTSPRHIPNPLNTRIITLLKHLQVSDQQPRTRKHQQAEVQTQWWSTPCFLVCHAR